MANSQFNEQSQVVTVCLSSLSEKDPLFEEKKRLLDCRNLQHEFAIPLTSTFEVTRSVLDQMVHASRIMLMNEVELYFAEHDDCGPFSPRNELESLNAVLSTVESLLQGAKSDNKKVLEDLQSLTVCMINNVGNSGKNDMIERNCSTAADELLLKWGQSNGVQTKLQIAYFEDAGRGLVASQDIRIGDVALEIPESLIISEDLVQDTDMFTVLKQLEGVAPDTMLLLWSMRERYNQSSVFRTYFETLPEEFNTGLSFGVAALSTLEGTVLFEELLRAKEHLREQFDSLFPALCMQYPAIFPLEFYTWDKFLWSCELWYSNGMKVVFSDGKLRTCLVPIAGFLNHSVCAHILHYGRVDPTTKSLKFLASRPCEAGTQCFLSYGSYPGSQLITFYGFLPKGDNYYDVIPLEFDVPDSGENGDQSPAGDTNKTGQMVRGTWLSKSSKLSTYGLPSKLLTKLRSALLSDCMDPSSIIPDQYINEENERNVLETIMSIFNQMLEGLGDSDEINRESCSWDVKLAIDYKGLQRKIICSIIASCTSGLEMLPNTTMNILR